MGSKKKKKALKRQEKEKAALKKQKATAPIKNPEASKNWKSIGVVLLSTFLCFSPSLQNQYVNWDDDRNFVENELVSELNDENFWANSVEIFKTDVIGGYNPITIWTFLVEQKLFDGDPFYRHLNNILLHLICTLFVFWIGIRLKLGNTGAIILALLFGIHPMRVESVAWVTERKDVLFGAFYLIALYYYIKGKQTKLSPKYVAIIAVCFLISLFSKIQAVILPISMILVDYYLAKEPKITIKSILTKVPYLLMSLIVGIIGIKMLQDQGSIEQEYEGLDRIFIGSYSLSTYYVKSLIPFRLSPLYPYPAKLDWTFTVSILSFIVTAAALLWSYLKEKREIFFGLSFFMANVILLLQILGAGQGFLADRFTYIAYIGIFFIFAFYGNKLIEHQKFGNIAKGLFAVIFIGYGFLTFQQNKVWKNSDTLWSHVLKHYNKTTLPWGNRANYYRDIGETKKALADYSQVIKLKPDKPEPYNSRARLYFNFNERDSLLKALENYNKAIELKPTDVEYIVNRGATYAKLGDFDNALASLTQAEQVNPNFQNIYLNRSVIYNRRYQFKEALADVTKYLQLKPQYPDMWYEKGRLHNILKQNQQAVDACNRAINMNNRNGLYYFERAKGYYFLGNITQAKADLQLSTNLGYKGNEQVTNQILNAR